MIGNALRAFERRADVVNPVHPRDPGLVSLFDFHRESDSGVMVDEGVATSYAAVYACVKVLAETVASVPLHVFERLDPMGKRRAVDHPLHRVLHRRPNPEMTSAEWREAAQAHLGLRGNHYSQIVRNAGGDVIELWPIPPHLVTVRRVRGELRYLVRLPGGEERRLRADQILHLRGLSGDGVVGWSPIRMARETIGLGVAAERFGARLFANGSSPRGVLQLPEGRNMTPEQHDEFIKRWQLAHEGMNNQHRVAILPNGMEWQQVGVNPDDAQFLETRKFQVEEVARWYRMPLHKIQMMDRSTFSNIEQQSIEFLTDTMAPWFVKWEQGLAHRLLDPDEARVFVEFQLQGFLRGDSTARSAYYRELWNIGAITADEIRDFENMNPHPNGWGARPYTPLNMIPAGAAPLSAGGEAERLTQAEALERRAEERAARAAEERRRLTVSFEPVFRDALERVVRSERREVSKNAPRLLDRRDLEAFNLWLEEFYDEHEDFIARQIRPAVSGLSDAIFSAAAKEAAADPGDPGGGLADFVTALVATIAARYANSSRAQLQTVASEAGPDKALGAVEDRLSAWSETRPGRVALRETVQTAGAVAKHAYQRAGVQQLRWVAFGDTCPFCQSLDGKVVGIEQTFASKGDLFEAEGREPLVIRKSIGHPPIHPGCDCGIAPA